MLELHFKEATAVDTNPIELEQVINTNNGLDFNENVITHLTDGIYEIVGMVTLQATSVTNIGVAIYTDDVKQGNDDHFFAAAEGEVLTIPIYGILKIVPNETGVFAKTMFRSIGAPKVIAGTVSVKKIV